MMEITPRERMRLALLDLTLGTSPEKLSSEAGKDPAIHEALRRYAQGDRVLNAHLFERGRKGFVMKGAGRALDPVYIKLNSRSGVPRSQCPAIFWRTCGWVVLAIFTIEPPNPRMKMGCSGSCMPFLIRRFKIVNLDQFERKNVDGKTLITRRGSNARISGLEVKLSTDQP